MPVPRQPSRALTIIPLMAAVALAAGSALAQAPEEPSSMAGDAAPKAPPTAAEIRASDAPAVALGQRLDTITAALAASSAPTRPPVDPAGTAVLVRNLEEQVRERVELTRTDILAGLSPGIIDGLASSLTRIEREVQRSRADLSAAATELEGRLSKLRAEREFLRAVLGVVRQDELPPTLFARSRESLAAIDQTRFDLRTSLDQLVELESRLAQVQASAKSGMDGIRSQQAAATEGVFRLDQPPLWRVLKAASPPDSFLRNLVNATSVSVREYLVAYPGAWAGLLALLGAILALTFGLRRASLRGAAGTEAQAEAESDLLVQRPVSVSVLVWVAVGPVLFGANLPLAIDFLRIAIAAATAWRLLPLLLGPAARAAATGILALTVVATAVLMAGTSSVNTRLLLFLIGGGATFLLWRIAIAIRTDTGRIGRLWGRVLKVTVAVGQYLAAASVVATVAGAVTLGSQLLYGTLFAVSVPLLLSITERVLRTMIRQALQRPPLGTLRAVRAYPDLVRRRLYQFVDLLLVLLFLPVMTRLFPFLDPFFAALWTFAGTPLTLGGLKVSLLNVLALGAGVFIALGVAKLVRFLLQEEVLPRTPLAMGSAAAASRLTYYGLVIAGLFLALAAAGFEISQLTLLVSALSVGIGFGLQNIVNNFVSGIVLAFERPIQPGDMVALGTMTGRVRDIGLRATTVRTFDGADVIVPNSQFISAEVINWTLADRARRIDIPVGVAYGTDLRRAIEVMRGVVMGHPNVAQSPEPNVVFRRFGESSIDFSVLFWSSDADQAIGLMSEIGISIWEALEKAGISIPFPQRDLHIVSGAVPGAPAGKTSVSAPPADPLPSGHRTGGLPRVTEEPHGDRE
jgi:small-conductance mechanosensitive channel